MSAFEEAEAEYIVGRRRINAGAVLKGVQMSDGTRSRSDILLDGRRVTIADLMNGGLLSEGTRLSFKRRPGETHHATVTSDGKLRLDEDIFQDVGGQIVASPSRAAGVLSADGGSFNGWLVWLDPSGRSLDSLRAELLDRVAAEPPQEDERGDRLVTPQEWLKNAREQVDSGTPVELSVRDLIGKWKAKGRGIRVIEWIDADLENHGLATLPAFHNVTLDATVKLVTPESEPAAGHDETNDERKDAQDFGLKVGNLPSALDGVSSISPNGTFDEAITLMVRDDFSQLPVLSGEHNLRGAVSWQSIARAQHANPNASFSAAVFEPRVVTYDRDLIDVLPLLREADFVLVRDEKKRIAGIVTTADVVQVYGQSAAPFFLIGELDRMLRNVIKQTFDLDVINQICWPDGSSALTSHDDLTMGDYQRILEVPNCWEQLGWPLHRRHFVERLNELREIRNDIMHFNLDIAVDDDAVSKLRNMIRVLRDYGSRDNS